MEHLYMLLWLLCYSCPLPTAVHDNVWADTHHGLQLQYTLCLMYTMSLPPPWLQAGAISQQATAYGMLYAKCNFACKVF